MYGRATPLKHPLNVDDCVEPYGKAGVPDVLSWSLSGGTIIGVLILNATIHHLELGKFILKCSLQISGKCAENVTCIIL